jgi:hypothetical protein
MAFKINPPGTTAPAAPSTSTPGPAPVTLTSKPSAFPSPRPRPFPPRERNFGNREDKDSARLNERIRVPQVRLIDEKGEQVGIVPTSQALQMARDKGLDLMEISPNAQPPVCKICDYGKFKYEKKKKEQHYAQKNAEALTHRHQAPNFVHRR